MIAFKPKMGVFSCTAPIGTLVNEFERIKHSISNLSYDDLARFRIWFMDFDARVWDWQIENDQRAGKLDMLIAEGRAEYEAGRTHNIMR